MKALYSDGKSKEKKASSAGAAKDKSTSTKAMADKPSAATVPAPSIRRASGKQEAMEDKSEVKKGKESKKRGRAYRVLIRPLITEKAANLGSENKYVFEVAEDANKIEIAKAVDEVYGVKPISINIIRVKGKSVRHGRKTGKRKDWKKAIVMLPEGKSINIYEGV